MNNETKPEELAVNLYIHNLKKEAVNDFVIRLKKIIKLRRKGYTYTQGDIDMFEEIDKLFIILYGANNERY